MLNLVWNNKTWHGIPDALIRVMSNNGETNLMVVKHGNSNSDSDGDSVVVEAKWSKQLSEDHLSH